MSMAVINELCVRTYINLFLLELYGVHTDA